MKRAYVLALVFFLVISLLASCSNEVQNNDNSGNAGGGNEDSTTVVIDLSQLGSDEWVNVASDGYYRFENLDDEVLYAIEFQSGSRDFVTSRGKGNNTMDAGDNTVLIPDENRENSGTGSDFGAQGDNDKMRVFHIDVANPKEDGALSIVANEEDYTSDACEEWNERERYAAYRGFKKEQFYHVNFNSKNFRDLDKSRIFMVIEDRGGSDMGGVNWGIVTIGKGYNADSFSREINPSMYMYDFSDVPFVNIYHSVEMYFTEGRWKSSDSESRRSTSTVLILNPSVLSYTDSYSLKSKDRILSIPKAEDDDEYVIVTSGCDLGNMLQLTDKEGRDYCFAYCLDSSAANKEYLVGKISEEVFFDLGYSRSEGTVSIRKATAGDEIKGAIRLSSPDFSFVDDISASEGKYHLYMPVFAENGYVPSNLAVSVYVVDEHDAPVAGGNFNYYFTSGHADGVGSSGEGYSGESCVDHKVHDSDVLKSIEITVSGLSEDAKLKVRIKDGSTTFKVGQQSRFRKLYDVDTAGLYNRDFFIDFEAEEPVAINENNIFWYVVSKDDYDANVTLIDAAQNLSDIVDSLGIDVERTQFNRVSDNALELVLEMTAKGTATENTDVLFIFAKYTGVSEADFMTLTCQDEKLEELVNQKFTFFRTKPLH